MNAHEQEIKALKAALLEYAQHQAWRCEYPGRYPWNPDCPCGLMSALEALGFDTTEMREWAIENDPDALSSALKAASSTSKEMNQSDVLSQSEPC